MTEHSRNVIAKNVKLLRLLLGLSQLNFSIVTGISRASLINIESGKTGYNLDLLDYVGKFTGHTLSDLCSIKFNPKEDIRERLLDKYKISNIEYYNILFKTPEIVYAIRYKLLKGPFLNESKQIREIRQELISLYKWDYKSSSISNALNRMPKFILSKPHPVKLGTKIYSKNNLS